MKDKTHYCENYLIKQLFERTDDCSIHQLRLDIRFCVEKETGVLGYVVKHRKKCRGTISRLLDIAIFEGEDIEAIRVLRSLEANC